MEFRARIANQGDDKIIIVPHCYRAEFPHRAIVSVKLVENEPNTTTAPERS